MILSPPELELIIILQEKRIYPRNKEDLLKHIRQLDEQEVYSDRISKKVANPIFSIEEYYNSLSEASIELIIKTII
jgi:hypothetical protein